MYDPAAALACWHSCHLQVAQRHAVMFDYSGAAPISRRSLNMLPFDPVERSIIQSPVGSPFPRGAHPKGAASTAAHLPGDPIIHLGRDLIRMHGRAVQARKGHDFIEGSLSLRRQSTWRTSEGGIKGLSKVTSVQPAPKAAQSLPASLRPLVQDVRGFTRPVNQPHTQHVPAILMDHILEEAT